MREAKCKEILSELAQVQTLCAEKKNKIAVVESQTVEWSEYYDRLMREGRIGMELAMTDKHIASLHRSRDELMVSLEILERKRADVMEQYLIAHKELKMVETLKEKRREEFMSEARREEDKASDEMATLRYAREVTL